ncbi:MAG: cellulose biosynthesis cyclic di-GMP-binding regulatory protein BcsB [Cyanobacteria bacterium J06554_6]
MIFFVRRQKRLWLFLCGLFLSLLLGLGVQAQTPTDQPTQIQAPNAASGGESGSSGERRNREPLSASETNPALDAAAAELTQTSENQYILEFNRSPIVGSRLRLEGIYNESRLRFSRPRNWDLDTVKILLRYRHSAALYATRSNLNVLVNGSNVGSVPLNNKQGETGTVIFDIPTRIIQDYNEVIIAGLQNNSPTCTQDPFDPSLWTEILPDSKLVFNYSQAPFSLDFNSYPYPLIDVLSLEPNRLDYVMPDTPEPAWLTAVAQLQASVGRIADYRPLAIRQITTSSEAQAGDKMVVVGTPAQQPILADLPLPLKLRNGKLLDAQQQVIAEDTGVLMWTVLDDRQVPVLVATGNGFVGVDKAVRFLVQSQDRKIGAGQVVLVETLEEIESPALRDWPRYLPLSDDFELGDLAALNGEPLEDVTIRGAHAPPFEFDFRALPDDQFEPGNVMTLRYTYGPQVNPLTSLVEVQLDGITLDGRRLSSIEGKRRETLKVELPENHITPHSKLRVFLRFDPRERRSCSRVTDHQLWGTVHADTHFKLNRQQITQLPDLKLLQSGYPFAAPQDLSRTAIVMSDRPRSEELALMLEVSERLGRLSRAETVRLSVYSVNQLPETVRAEQHLIGIGLRSGFPFPEAFEQSAFSLQQQFARQWGESRVQTLPDAEGLVQQQISPWNDSRILLSLMGQTPAGLAQVQNLFDSDSLFFQLEGDTVLISANEATSPYDQNAYNLEFLQRSPQRGVYEASRTRRLLSLLKGNWLVLVPGMMVLSLGIYGIAQSYLRRLTSPDQASS